MGNATGVQNAQVATDMQRDISVPLSTDIHGSTPMPNSFMRLLPQESRNYYTSPVGNANRSDSLVAERVVVEDEEEEGTEILMMPSLPLSACLGYRHRSGTRSGCVPIYHYRGRREETGEQAEYGDFSSSQTPWLHSRGKSGDFDTLISPGGTFNKPSWSDIRDGETLVPRLARLAELRNLISSLESTNSQEGMVSKVNTDERDETMWNKHDKPRGSRSRLACLSTTGSREIEVKKKPGRYDETGEAHQQFRNSEGEGEQSSFRKDKEDAEETSLVLKRLLEESEDISRDVKRVTSIAERSFKLCGVPRNVGELTERDFKKLWTMDDYHDAMMGKRLFHMVDTKGSGRINFKRFIEGLPLVAFEVIDSNLEERKNIRQTFRYTCI